jgi:hypothetical protein
MKPVEIAPEGLQTGPDHPPAIPISAQKTSRVLPQTIRTGGGHNPQILRSYELLKFG